MGGLFTLAGENASLELEKEVFGVDFIEDAFVFVAGAVYVWVGGWVGESIDGVDGLGRWRKTRRFE